LEVDVAKPDDVTWHEYLRGYGRLRWRHPGDEQRFHEVCGLIQPLHALMCGNLLDQTGPKVVIAQPTPLPVQGKGHTPFLFRLQCLITGRLSRAIPYERLIEFGVLTEDTRSGGPFRREKLAVENRVAPAIHDLTVAQARYAPFWESADTPWHERYDEYLRSEEWLSIRRQVLRRDNFRCRHTGKLNGPGDPLQVHHLTYDRVGHELLDDLITLCRSAHRQLHKK
jgi:5-methylcytosine-specific restriction endonuclease McrA